MTRQIAIACVAVALVCSTAGAQESRSAAAAKALTGLLAERNVEAIATRDPEQQGRFIAALYIPSSQLLVIASPHPAPATIDYRLAQGLYRDVYTDLHGSTTVEGRVFVTDLQADGLRRLRDENAPFDVVYRDGEHYMSYDGDWDRQELTESEYNTRFEKDDAEYARMLSALADALRAPATQTPPTGVR